MDALKEIHPTGIVFHHKNLKVVGDANFIAGVFKTDFDSWWWLQIFGEAGKDDFGYNGELVVSQRVMDVTKKFKLDYCEVDDFDIGA